MRERAKRAGAELHLRSGPGSGTEIEIRIPARLAFGDGVPADKRSWFRGHPTDPPR
jgi:signal transduction histidine kinase